MAIRILILICAAAVSAASSPASPDEAVVAALKLTTEYKKEARPPPDHNLTNTLNVFIYLNSLLKVDSTMQEIKLKVWLNIHWIDSRLAWLGKFNSSLDNVSAISLPATSVWLPDASFYDVMELTDITESRALVQVNSSGRVFLSKGIVLKKKCSMPMHRFPFDEQSCVVRLSTLQQVTGVSRIRINSQMGLDSLDSYVIRSSEFCICWITLIQGNFGPYDTAEFRVGFQRLTSFYIVNLMVPSVLLLAVSAIVFRLPPNCGERVSFSITIVLSMCVFLQLAGNYVPTQSESVPLITWFFSFEVLMTILNVLGNAFVLRCHSKQEGCVSNRLIRALFLNQIVQGRGSQQRKVAQDPESPQTGSIELQEIGRIASSVSGRESEWKAVASGADRVFFVAFVCTGFVLLAIPFVIASASARPKCIESELGLE